MECRFWVPSSSSFADQPYGLRPEEKDLRHTGSSQA